MVAHPDDEVLGVGGAILRHVADGDEVSVRIECMDGLRNALSRTNDAKRVAGRMGTRLSFGESRQLGYEVPSFDIEADLYYTHHPDLNRDHRLVNEGVLVAARGKSVRTFETLSSTEWATEPFMPNLYMAIDIFAKLACLREYASELRPWPHPRSLSAVLNLAQFRGSAALLQSAEAFHIVREVR